MKKKVLLYFLLQKVKIRYNKYGMIKDGKKLFMLY